MQTTKSTLWPIDEREPSAVHTVSKCASSSVKYRTMFRRLLEEDEAKCKGSRRPGHRRTRGRAGGCVHTDTALTLQPTAAAVDMDHVLKLSTELLTEEVVGVDEKKSKGMKKGKRRSRQERLGWRHGSAVAVAAERGIADLPVAVMR